MSNEFNEEYRSDDTEPLHQSQVADFDWEELSSRLGEASEVTLNEADYSRLVVAIGVLLDFLVPKNLKMNKKFLHQVGLRAVAMTWVVNPKQLSGESVRSISDKLGFTPPVLSVLTAEFSRRFKVSNDNQAHDWRKGDTSPCAQ